MIFLIINSKTSYFCTCHFAYCQYTETFYRSNQRMYIKAKIIHSVNEETGNREVYMRKSLHFISLVFYTNEYTTENSRGSLDLKRLQWRSELSIAEALEHQHKFNLMYIFWYISIYFCRLLSFKLLMK